METSSPRARAPPPPREEHRCKDCRYWYGADSAGLRPGLSAPYTQVLAGAAPSPEASA